MTSQATAAAGGQKRRRPAFLLGGILPIDSSRVPVDVIAGATLAALAIPEVMGYTKIAGTPVITGLYTLLLPVLFFAIFGSSRHLVVGADSATAAILATGLLAMGAVSDSPQYVALAGLAALMCGVLLVAARFLRLGFIANFLSRSVLIGFLTGVGIQVAMGQVGGMFGISGETGRTVQKFLDTLAAIPTQTNVPTLLISIAVLGTIVVLGRVNKAIPGALFAVVGAIVLSYAVNLTAYGVTLLGPVPSGLPSLALPPDVITTANITALLPTTVSLVVVILAQSAATARAYALKYGDSLDENVDLVGLGLANVGAGISGTFVVNGSPTKTEMVDGAGGRSQIAQLVTAALVVVVLLFLTVPLSYMPNAVLSSVVFLIGLRLVDVRGMADIARLRPGEFLVAAITAVVVVVVGVEQGIVLALILSIFEHIQHSYHPHDTKLAFDDEGQVTEQPLQAKVELEPGLVVYRFGANLYYANASRFAEEILQIAETADPPLRWLAISCSSIGDIDFSGADQLEKLVGELGRLHIVAALSDVSKNVRKQLDDYKLTEVIGADHIFSRLSDLVDAYKASGNTPTAGGSPEPAPA
jgi:high affinity sulfate transporter 1